MKETYAESGVDIDRAAKAKKLIGRHARLTHRPEVMGGTGFFGGLFEFKGYKQPVLVSSVDGVGTKLKIASAMAKHDTIGIDLVNHCVNDILACGAEPLFFLDYIAMGKLLPEQVEAIVKGLARACREVGCALIGGETAEMPGLYSGEDYDLVGFIVGVVEKDRIINGDSIVPGDAILGLPSTGLHTNGYSLARKIFGETPAAMSKRYPELERTIGEELLEPHRCYFKQLKPLLPLIKGLAHITSLAPAFLSILTTPKVVRMLRKAGAKEVHMRICAPPIRYPCFFGVDMATRGELIASQKTVPEIRDFIGADSLGYLSIEGLVKAVALPENIFCMACFTGDYPMPVQLEMDKLALEHMPSAEGKDFLGTRQR